MQDDQGVKVGSIGSCNNEDLYKKDTTFIEAIQGVGNIPEFSQSQNFCTGRYLSFTEQLSNKFRADMKLDEVYDHSAIENLVFGSQVTDPLHQFSGTAPWVVD